MPNPRFAADELSDPRGAACPFPSRHGPRDHAPRQPLAFVSTGVDDATAPMVDPMLELRAQAEEAGFNAGYAQGQDAAAREVASLQNAWKASLEDLVALRSTMLEAYRQELVELALHVAQALVQRDLTEHAQTTVALIDEAIALLGTSEDFKIALSAADQERLTSHLTALSSRVHSLKVQIDPSLRPGDVRVTTAAGSVEAVLSHRIAHVRSIVTGTVAIKADGP